MKYTSPAVTIGIAVRYEQPDNLRRFVQMLSVAAHLLDEHTESEVCFCLNGSSPDTRRFLQDALQELHDPDLHFNYLQSPAGKIRAHETIASNRELDGFLLFADADILFNETLFLQMYKFLIKNPKVQACYAEVSALPSVAGGLFGKLQDAYYLNRHHKPVRPYLHGRCFMLRKWFDEFGARHSPSINPPADTTSKLGLGHGPIVDDIHYSRVLVHQFGRSSIAMVPDVHVQFIPPYSVSELYRDSCRTELELFRLNILFPEHAHTEDNEFTNKQCLSQRWHTLLRMGLLSTTYLFIEKTMRHIARYKAQRQMASLSEGGICPDDTGYMSTPLTKNINKKD